MALSVRVTSQITLRFSAEPPQDWKVSQVERLWQGIFASSVIWFLSSIFTVRTPCSHTPFHPRTRIRQAQRSSDSVSGTETARDALRNVDGSLSSIDARSLEEKARSQIRLVRSGEDLRVLKKAMSAFTSLQHVQILRLQDESDRRIVDLLRDQNIGHSDVIDMRWTPACIHASKTVAQALLYAHSPVNRFSGPMMNAPCVMALGKRLPEAVSQLSAKLTCLELHFDGGPELNDQMKTTSRMFRTVFSEARNLQALHVGFPSRIPLDMKLDDIFHGIKWERLRAFGIQAWRLGAEEIIEIARRHSRTLRGLRLRDVILREGSMWKEVLSMLRSDMHQLAWVSLRRIDYESHFDEIWANSMEVAELTLADTSESDDEEDPSYRPGVYDTDLHDIEEEDEDEDEHEDEEEDDGSDNESDANTDNGPDANDLAIPPDTPVSLPFCTCSRSSYPASADDLGDNGKLVTYQQRKLWEKWVIGQCPEHDRGSA